MRFVTIVALLFSAVAFAAPMEAMDEADSSQDVAGFPGIPDFADFAEFADWAEAVDLDNMEDSIIGKGLKDFLKKKAPKTLAKVGKAVLKNGPQILETATAIHNTLKEGKQAAQGDADAAGATQ